MATEYRRMLLTGGPTTGVWENLTADQAQHLILRPVHVGELGDPRNDLQCYLERRENGGPWTTYSYFAGANEMWVKARLMEIQRLEGDVRRLRERAQGITDGAGAQVQGARNRITQAEGDLQVALESEKHDKAAARDLQKQAEKVEAQIAPLRREIDLTPPAPVASPDELETAKT